MKLLKTLSLLLIVHSVAGKLQISLSLTSQLDNRTIGDANNEIELPAELLQDQSEEITEALDKVAISLMDSGNYSLDYVDSNNTNDHWELIDDESIGYNHSDTRLSPLTMKLEESASEIRPKKVKVKNMKETKKRKIPAQARRKRRRGKGKGKGRKKHHRRSRYCMRHGYRHHLCNRHCTYRPRTTCVTITSTTTTTTTTTNTPSTSTESTTASSTSTTPSSTITSTSTTPSSTITSTVSTTSPTSSTTVPPVTIMVTQNILVYDSICSWKRNLVAKLQQLFYYIEANRPIDYAYYGNVLQKVLNSMACICRCKDLPLPQQMRLLFKSQHIYNKIAAKFPHHWVPNQCRLRGVLFLCGGFKVKV